MKKLLLTLLFLPLLAWGLEVDEKLTIRIVKSSETRKTIMINRGTEDGLVEGDHARFIVTAGIVARAICVKVSPARSVWSVYRLVNADFIQPDAVMTLKITPAVKITKDESQSLVEEDTPTRPLGEPADIGIPLAEGANDIVPGQAASEASEIAALEGEAPVSLVDRNIEAFGVLNISGLSATSKTDGGDSFKNSQSYHHIGLGGEYYLKKEREWYSKFSLMASVNLMRLDSQAYNGTGTTNDVTEFSLGLNWHPTKLPSLAFEFIPFFHLSFNTGSVKSTYKPGTEAIGGQEFTSSGNTTGFAAGFGYKFYTHQGFGVRALFDYYLRNEKYSEDHVPNIHTKSVAGPRFMIGLGYRF